MDSELKQKIISVGIGLLVGILVGVGIQKVTEDNDDEVVPEKDAKTTDN